MDDMKSYTVRVETGEIRLMSQEEVSKLVRTTMARAESGAQNTKKTSKFARSKGTYTIASDLSRRLSLSPRPLSSTRALHLSKNPEERAKSPTSKLFKDFRAAVSTGATSIPPEESRDDNNTSIQSKRTDMKESSRSREERFSALVRTVGPTVIDPENDPRDVSFTVSTEVDGPKNLSEKELHALVRSSIVRAKFNARYKKSRRKLDYMIDNDSSMQSPDTSPTKRISRKFSWSTVEKSDDEEFEDFRDDENVEVKNDMIDIRQESESREQTSKDNQTAVDEMVNAEKSDLSTHGSGEIFITPCTSSKNDAIDFAATKQLRNEDELKRTIRQPESETQLLSLVLSGGDTSISDKDICNMVKHSMAKAKLTRQEISDLLEDTGTSTPSGATKMDVASMFEGIERRAKESSRVLGVKSFSPRRRRSLGLNVTRAEAAPILELPASIDGDNEPVDTGTIPTEIAKVNKDILAEIILQSEDEKISAEIEISESCACTSTDEAGISPPVVVQDSETPEFCPNTNDDNNNIFVAHEAVADEGYNREIDDPVYDKANVDNPDFAVLSQPDVQTGGDTDMEIDPPLPIEELSHDITKVVPHQEQSNSCCFQMCCMPIILSSSSVAEKEELDRAPASISTGAIEQHKEEAVPLEEMPELNLNNDVESSVFVEAKLEEQRNEIIPPVHDHESIIDLTDVVSTGSIAVSPEVHKKLSLLNDDANNEEMNEVKNDQDPVVDTVVQASLGDHNPLTTDNTGDSALHDAIEYHIEDLNGVRLDHTTIDESPCLTCFHVPMNPENISVEVKNEQHVVESETLNKNLGDNAMIVSKKSNLVSLDAPTETVTLSPEDLNTSAAQEKCTNEQKSHSKINRHPKFSKYRRFKEYYDVKTVITDEFLNQVISRKGSKISVSELAKILNGETTKSVEDDIKVTDDNDSALHNNHSADDTMPSDRSDIEEKIDASLEQGGFCVDFMSIFSDLDLRGVDDDFGSASLFPDDSRAVTWMESVADAESKDEITDHGATRSIDADDDRPPKITEYESEFVASLDENERRRLTFSFSEGRYTGSLSSLDDY